MRCIAAVHGTHELTGFMFVGFIKYFEPDCVLSTLVVVGLVTELVLF